MCVWFLFSGRCSFVSTHVRFNLLVWQKCDFPHSRRCSSCLPCPCLAFFFFFSFLTASWGNVMIHTRRRLTSGPINQLSSTVGNVSVLTAFSDSFHPPCTTTHPFSSLLLAHCRALLMNQCLALGKKVVFFFSRKERSL